MGFSRQENWSGVMSLSDQIRLVAQSCPTLCHPMDCSPPSSPVHGDSPGKNTGVDCHALLQGIFPTQGSNPGLPAMQETCVRSLGWEDPLEEGMATHSSILAWRIPMDRGAWWATVHGVTESRTQVSTHTYIHRPNHMAYSIFPHQGLNPDHQVKAWNPNQ